MAEKVRWSEVKFQVGIPEEWRKLAKDQKDLPVRRIDDYINEEITILDFRIQKVTIKDQELDMALILLEEGSGLKVVARTFSRVLMRQLQQMRPLLDEGKAIVTVVRKRKRYLTFE